MRQVLHIFRKDCRQFWPEILASLLITVMFVWVYPYQWLSPYDPRFDNANRLLDLHHLQILASVITGLLPLSWFILIARVVHAENLIGTRQFWVTRPYIWQKLLAEKVVFLVAFLYLPFAFAQLALLRRAGFSPFHLLPGLFFNLLLLTGICVLPILSFAAVISSLRRMFLVLLAICAFLGVIAFFASSSHSDSPSLQIPYSDRISVPLVLIFCSAALVCQYYGRRLWLARALLITGVITIAIAASNPLESTLFEDAYPTFNQALNGPFHAYLPTDDEKPLGTSYPSLKSVSLRLTVRIPALRRDQAVSVDDSSVTIDGADGTHVTSPWSAVYNQRALDGSTEVELDWTIDRASFDRVRSHPVKITVNLAVTLLQSSPARQVALQSSGEFSVPGVGLCSYEPAADFGVASLTCKVPWHQPLLTHVSARVSNSPCGKPSARDEPTQSFSDWAGALEQDPADFGLTPVWTTSILFSGTAMYSVRRDGIQSHPNFICPGTLLVLAPYHAVQRFRYQLAPQVISIPETSDQYGSPLIQPR